MNLPNSLDKASIVGIRPAGVVTATERKVYYEVVATNLNAVSVMTFDANQEFFDEIDEAFPFLEGHEYPLSEFTADFNAKSYNALVIAGDQGYKYVLNSRLTATATWTLGLAATGRLQFAFTADTTTYAIGAREAAEIIISDGNNIISSHLSLPGVAPWSCEFSEEQLASLDSDKVWTLTIILKSSVEDYGQIYFDDIVADTVLGAGISGNQTAWS